MDQARTAFGVVVSIIAAVLREYLWYRVNYRSRRSLKRPDRQRIRLARRRARLAARKPHPRAYTGKTERLDQ